MCLLVFARHSHPHYPLVVVANRDELHARPARIAGWWPEHPAVLAGHDLQAGGTWMGVNLAGCWGAVTNYRDGVREPALRSRGELVTDFLSAEQEPRAYLDAVARRGGDYGGFSLLVGDVENLYCYSNRATGIQQVSSGIHTLSNHLLDTPWPKAELARLKLGRALRKSTLALEDLLAVLADAEPFADHELPATGVGIELERVLSPPFITGGEYGTRCTTVLMVDRDGNAVYGEQSFAPGGVKGELALYDFPIS